MKSIGHHVDLAFSLVPAVRTATTSSETVVDTKGLDNICWAVGVGDIDLANTDETYVAQVYESASSNGASPVAITGATATVTADNQIKKIQVNKLGTGDRLRYQFVRFTLAGTTPSMPGFALGIGFLKNYKPDQSVDASV